VRSARSLIIVLALLPLAGCATTQDRNARAKLSATRLLSARKAVELGARNPDVTVGKVALLHHSGAAAIVVELRSGAKTPLTDLPILVGLQHGERRTYLNRRAGLGYFQSHLAAIAAGGRARWVFTTRHAGDLSGTPFALVGTAASPPISSAVSLPELETSAVSGLGPTVRVRVHNATSVPQYEAPVYAFAQRGTRYVAAGRATLAHLGTGQDKQLVVHLIGTTGGAQLSLQTQPSMFE
jgi:hypothetical protein